MMECDKYMYSNPQMVDWSRRDIESPKDLFDRFGWSEEARWNDYFLFAATKCKNPELVLVNHTLYELQGSYNFKAFTPQLLAELFNVSVYEIEAVIEFNAVSIESLQGTDWCNEVEEAFIEWWVRGYMALIGIPDALYPNVANIIGVDCSDVNQIHHLAPDMLKELKDFALLYEAEKRQELMNELGIHPPVIKPLPNSPLDVAMNPSNGAGVDAKAIAAHVRQILGSDTNELLRLSIVETIVDGGYQGNYINVEPKYNVDKEPEE